MKAYVTGMRSLLYYTAHLMDRVTISKDENEKAKYNGLVELLTPIIKGYVSDRAFEVIDRSIQVYGGYGYTKEFPVEQLLRDCRITRIYEGANGIQAMDFLGRKLGMNKGQTVLYLLGEIQSIVDAAKKRQGLEELADKTEKAVKGLTNAALHIGGLASGSNIKIAFAYAYPFMEVVGDVLIAWKLLERAVIAHKAVYSSKSGKPGKKDVDFYDGQIKTAGYFIDSILPVTHGKIEAILNANEAPVSTSKNSF